MQLVLHFKAFYFQISSRYYRADENVASNITYEIKGVSIGNETDWTRMAKFHAEWSKKFYEAFVPLLKTEYQS